MNESVFIETTIPSYYEGGYWAICPEAPGANGQGETVNEARQSLLEAVAMITETLDEPVGKEIR